MSTGDQLTREVEELRRRLAECESLAAIAGSFSSPLIRVDLDGTIRAWNDAAARTFGYTADEVIGKHVDLLVPETDRENARDRRARVGRGESIPPQHVIRVRKDGVPIEHAAVMSPVRNASGEIIGVSVMAHDIAAPSTHDIAAYRLAAIVSSSDDAIVSKDLNGIVRSWNHAAERMFGYTEREMIGRSITTIFPPDRLHEEDYVLTEIRAGRGIEHFETVRQRKDGTLINVSLTVSPIKSSDGRIIGASKIARDITERSRLDEAAYRLAAIVESSDDVIVSKDLNGIVRSWNRAAEKLFGYTASEMIGRSITTIIPPERVQEEDAVLAKIRAGDTVDHFETVRRRKDGTLVDVSLTVSPVRDRTGRVVGASKIARDITERKRLAEIQRHMAEAEDRARRERLEVENRRIQEASRIKSEFVANMSHELRTPLHAILGFTEVFVDQRLGPVSEEYREIGNIVLSSARHLLQLINDILDLAKVESGTIQFHPEPIDLAALLAEVHATIKGLAAKAGVSIAIEVDPALDGLHLDPAKLKQVFYNYLSNAIKFTREGGHVTVRVRGDADASFRIEVEDTGIGVPADEQHRLFVEFQQLDPGTAKRYPGTGLGLALTKRIVEAQGGTVGVRSEPGVGSTFYARLPRTVMPMLAAITSPASGVVTADRSAETAG